MIKSTLEIIDLLYSTSPFLFGLIFYTLLALALHKNIKKHAKKYYWGFGLVSACFIVPFLLRMIFNVNLPFSFNAVPILGQSMSEFSHAAGFVHPVLVLIMYMGAFSPKNKSIGKLMSIRKELSIIVGFPLLAHALMRVFSKFPEGWRFFFNNEVYMESPRVTSAVGSALTSFAFVLGLVMFILFLVLWITSFDSVHKKLGAKRWKAVQKWSYGLYAMLFIHAMCLQAGGYISDSARAAKEASAPRTEQVAHSHAEKGERPAQEGQTKQGHSHGEQGQKGAQASQGGHSHGAQAQQGPQAKGGKPKGFSFESWKLSRTNNRIASIIIYILVYGSYLYFRLRKARLSKQKRAQHSK
ncbi:MAG: ferric reductase-like transmembrane domain-containing protein [Rikenellaceae bacterium]